MTHRHRGRFARTIAAISLGSALLLSACSAAPPTEQADKATETIAAEPLAPADSPSDVSIAPVRDAAWCVDMFGGSDATAAASQNPDGSWPMEAFGNLPLAGCLSEARKRSAAAISEEATQPDGGTGGQLIPIQSDNVDQAGYDAATQTMTVVFDSGSVYAYYSVPLSLWQDFVAAQPHPWSAVGKPRLVDGRFPYQRIG